MPFDQTIRLIITVKNPYFNIYLFFVDEIEILYIKGGDTGL
jgi:hypothetical protein